MSMGNLDINQAVSSSFENATAYSIAPMDTDSIMSQEETTWLNSRWTQQYGYFCQIPDLKSAILLKAIFQVGKGFTADSDTMAILEHVDGMGKDTIHSVLFNMEVIKRIGGDAYAEIIRDPDTKMITNLKVLNPGRIRVVFNASGRIIRYEQIIPTPTKGIINKVKNLFKKEAIVTFKPEEILHLSNNRLADQTHGTSDIDALEKTILADEELFDNINKVMRRQARPLIIFKLGTDDAATIAAFKAKMDDATAKGENMYVPFDSNTLEYDVVTINPTALLMQWADNLRNRFYRAIGLPQIVPGAGGQSTQSESQVIYLAFENIVEREQKDLEAQLWQQLTLKIDFYPPTTISEQLQSDTAKDGPSQGIAPIPSDMQPNNVQPQGAK